MLDRNNREVFFKVNLSEGERKGGRESIRVAERAPSTVIKKATRRGKQEDPRQEKRYFFRND